jgi:TM2 domain-containing membrane protein YozV
VTDPLLYTQGMTDHQRLLFMSEFNQRRKTGTTGVLLALFLGGIGAHRFYMGQIGWGIAYVLFCLTGIPMILGLIEAFLMSGRVERFNETAAQDVALRVKALTTSNTAQV